MCVCGTFVVLKIYTHTRQAIENSNYAIAWICVLCIYSRVDMDIDTDIVDMCKQAFVTKIVKRVEFRLFR